MNIRYFVPVFFTCFFLFTACEDIDNQDKIRAKIEFKDITIKYPEAYEDNTNVETFFGLAVSDPYRWLEYDSPSRSHWIKQQRSINQQYLKNIPFRDTIAKRLAQLWNFERFSSPEKHGDYFYMFKNDGLQNQDVLYRMKALSDEPTLVLNPNLLSKKGGLSLSNHRFSKDGSLMAYQVSKSGSDWKSIRIMDMADLTTLSEEIKWVKFSDISWSNDGFYYSRYPTGEEGNELMAINEFHQLYFHRIGTSQEEDELIFADRSHPRRNMYAGTTPDEQFLYLSVVESTSGNALYVKDLTKKNNDFEAITESYDYDFEVIGNIGNKLVVKTNYKAANWKIILISTTKPQKGYWEDLIAQGKDVIRGVELSADKIIVSYLHNASSQIKVFDTKGALLHTVELPAIGTVENMLMHEEEHTLFYRFSTLIQAPSLYSLDLTTYQSTIYKQAKTAFNTDDYVIKQEWFDSYDKQRVPLFIVHKKDFEPTADAPTLLYGYGGFDISIMPQHNVTRLNLFSAVLENGGVCAIASIRGGGEFGAKWHKGGMLKRKQTVFDDFQAAAEYLIGKRYTSSERLAIYGRSNGGLLVGACLTQRPDLYKVVIPAVGVLDMLRYEQFSIGWAWASEYGSASDKEMFDYLYAYSPLHNIDKVNYPATYITTADHDDRVAPAHSMKFAATLQAAQKGTAPILVRVDSGSGHGSGKPTHKKIAEAADILTFMFYNFKYEPYK